MQMNTFPLRSIFQAAEKNENAKLSRFLQWLDTTAISRPECERLMASDPSAKRLVGDDHICVRDRPGTTACFMDDGAGLVTRPTACSDWCTFVDIQ